MYGHLLFGPVTIVFNFAVISSISKIYISFIREIKWTIENNLKYLSTQAKGTGLIGWERG